MTAHDQPAMTTLGLYLNSLLFKRLGVVMFAVLGFATVFDLLDVIDDVIKDAPYPILAVLGYLALRLPSLLSQLLPLIALLGGLYFITDLMRNNELVVVWALGRSTRQVIVKLMPVLLVIAVGKFVIDDQLVPYSVAELREWRIGAFKRTNLVGSSSDEVWLKSGHDIVRIPSDSAIVGKVAGLSIFVRDAEGRLSQRLEASSAELTDVPDRWRLSNVVVHGSGGFEQGSHALLLWDGKINIDHVKAMARPARELTLLEQIKIINADGYAIRSTGAYVTWAHHRVVGSLIPSMLLALVLALARSFSRSGNALSILIPAVALGFGFLILNGVVLALGEVGVIAPLIAAWLPSITLFAMIAILLVRTNRLIAMRLSVTKSQS